MPHNLFNTRQTLPGSTALHFYALPALAEATGSEIASLPVCLRIVLEAVLRNFDGRRITEDDVLALAQWQPNAERMREIPFVVARILLQDFTGVPLLADLAAMRSAVLRMNENPRLIEPLVPVDLVIDHSVQVDFWSRPDALSLNMAMEFKRNNARYQFLKWGQQAFNGFNVVPPGIGICHQVNLEYLAQGVSVRADEVLPDTLVGTDSHTTMVNGLGVVGWGVGGIEAEAGMLGQPVYFLMPDVVGVNLTGNLAAGVTATDLVLHLTQLLRQVNVVGKFVEFHGTGAATLTAPDRATIGNMAPEYGATLGFFPVDDETCRYYAATGRAPEQVELVRAYFQAQGLFGIPPGGACRYSQVVELDLAEVQPSVAGPRRPQDRVNLSELKNRFLELLLKPVAENGYAKTADELRQCYPVETGVDLKPPQPLTGGGTQAPETAPAGAGNLSVANTSVLTEVEMMNNRPTPDRVPEILPGQIPADSIGLAHGDIVIAAITSCTNTSNPSVMLAAGLLAKKALERGLRVPAHVKPSLAPGSRVVTEYLRKTGLQWYLDQLGFNLVGYGCTTCIGNSGPLDPQLEAAITGHDLITASVLSGNRNFEARVHQSVKANFLMSPPLVVAYALAGSVTRDLTQEPLGRASTGEPVYLRELWPSPEEIQEALQLATDPAEYRRLYADVATGNPLWNEIQTIAGEVYAWDVHSTYIQEPPFFADFRMEPAPVTDVRGARALAIFGDSVTTDHISPAGAIRANSPAGEYLRAQGVEVADFNTYGARRGNHEVMVRGTFANVRIRNRLIQPDEGGLTVHQPSGERLSIYDAAQRYAQEGVPLLIFAGKEYGTGSSRDWAAKGSRLLGVRAVIAQSFERIHRSNLIGMGVLPCQFPPGVDARSLALDGTETFELHGLEDDIRPREELQLLIYRNPGHRNSNLRGSGANETVPVTLRIDTAIEADYYRHGGILPYVLRKILGSTR